MKAHFNLLLVIFVVLISTSCNKSTTAKQNTMVPSDIPVQSTRRNEWGRAEPVISPSPEELLTSTGYTTATFTPTLTETETPVPTPSWTPRPTLPESQAQTYALKMVKTNGGCKFPCWLGITPGKTTWVEAKAFLATFADSISDPEGNRESYYVEIKFPDMSYRGAPDLGANFYIKPDGVIDKISTLTDVSLPDLLETYGPPLEVRLLAIGVSTMDLIGHFTLVLFYQDQGFMAVYEGDNEINSIIHVCPNKIKDQPVWLMWDPADHLSFAEAGGETLLISPIPPPSEKDFIPIENLTDLDPESFYQRYKAPKSQGICMEMEAPDLH